MTNATLIADYLLTTEEEPLITASTELSIWQQCEIDCPELDFSPAIEEMEEVLNLIL